tara:strand:+ start:12562 stop:12876 length:315 start_codon:yes stop_codon:yes gene_type:complete
MSVDYKASFSIGYKVSASEDIAESEDLEYGLIDYLDCECGEEFDSFEAGCAFSGDIDFTCLIVRTPSIEGLDLSEVKSKLDAEVNRLGLDIESEFGLFGGVYCY